MARPEQWEGAQSPPAEAPVPSQRAVRRHSERESERDPESESVRELQLDPLSCQLACHGAFPHAVAVRALEAPAALQPSAPLPPSAELQQMLSGLARRVAWGGDRRKGSARIELSEGALAGATLIVHAEQRSVSVELELPPGAGTQGWEARLTERLEGRGFSARVRVA